MLLLCLPLIYGARLRCCARVILVLCERAGMRSAEEEHGFVPVWYCAQMFLLVLPFQALDSYRSVPKNQPTRRQDELNSSHVQAEEWLRPNVGSSLVSYFLFLLCLCCFLFSTMKTKSVPLFSSCQLWLVDAVQAQAGDWLRQETASVQSTQMTWASCSAANILHLPKTKFLFSFLQKEGKQELLFVCLFVLWATISLKYLYPAVSIRVEKSLWRTFSPDFLSHQIRL